MAKLSPVFNDQTFDVNGDPATGDKLFTFVAGSSTKTPVYTNEAGTIAHTNPIIIDSLGFPTQGPIWIPEGTEIKFVWAPATDTDPPTSPIKTIDNVSGVGDNTVSVSQWVASGVTPTYVSANSFTLVGDQTSEFHVGRRVQFTVGAGTVYGNITATVFTTLTTVTMQMDAGMVLDAGLTVANLSILRADRLAVPSIFNQSFSMVGTSIIGAKGVTVTSAATTNIWAATDGNIVDISDSNPINSLGVAPQAGYVIKGTFTGAPLITAGANLILNTAAPTFQVEAGDTFEVMANSTTQHSMVITRKSGAPISSLTTQPPVRQTVLSGPVDANGLPAFGGATGTSTVTASGTLVVTAANGQLNRNAAITNPSWTGLTTNGTMVLYVDAAADGSATTASSALLPTYRWGGADVVTNNQFTFNIQEMVGKLGNGTVATQTYRVAVGEVTVAGGVVTAITWYALMGRYQSALQTTPAATTPLSLNHNIGITPKTWQWTWYCNTIDGGHQIGDEVPIAEIQTSAGIPCTDISTNRLSSAIVYTSGPYINSKTVAAQFLATIARWNPIFYASRGW